MIPFLSALGLGGTLSVYVLSPYRRIFYGLALLFALIGFYINVIVNPNRSNITVYVFSMGILVWILAW